MKVMDKQQGIPCVRVLEVAARVLAAVLVALMVVAVLGGCSSKTETADGTSDFTGEFIISANEAKEKIGDGNVMFIDARGADEAAKGTVEGAVASSWQELLTTEEGVAGDEGWGLVPEPADLQARLRALGVDPDKEIIVLGETLDGWGEDGCLIWIFRQAGCTNIKMVDGGVSALQDIGVELVKEVATPVPSDINVESLDESHTITTEELQANYDEYTIIDTRTAEEYDGAVLYDEAQGGHLPGAIHIEYLDLFQDDGTLKSNDDITAMFEAAGVEKDDKVVTYCTGGIRSAYMQLVLEMCGYANTYNYGQSYWRWAVVGEVE